MRETPVCTAADAIYKLAAGNLRTRTNKFKTEQ